MFVVTLRNGYFEGRFRTGFAAAIAANDSAASIINAGATACRRDPQIG
jgi:hypothetical protein